MDKWAECDRALAQRVDIASWISMKAASSGRIASFGACLTE